VPGLGEAEETIEVARRKAKANPRRLSRESAKLEAALRHLFHWSIMRRAAKNEFRKPSGKSPIRLAAATVGGWEPRLD